jgi:polyhydroxybutyrate depolymerase
MCSSPDEPGTNVGAAGTPTQTAGTDAGGSSAAGSGAVLPSAGSDVGGSASSTAGTTAVGGESAGSMSGGSSGSGGGMSMPMGPMPTAGCMQPAPVEEPQKWLEKAITVANLPADQQEAFATRRYFVRLPVAYDHTKKYPVVFYGPGCGAKNVESTPMMDQIKNDAIHVFLLQKNDCFSTGSYPSPEVPYFTQALDEIQAKYCTDSSRVFVSGYSSGGWLSNVLACALGPRIRGIGTAAGGLRKEIVDGYKCSSPAAGIFYSGELDMTNPAVRNDMNGNPIGVIAARDRLITSNGCNPTANHVYADNPICQEWTEGCPNNPVLYCVGPGDGHNKGDGKFNVSNKAFWDVWSKLP